MNMKPLTEDDLAQMSDEDIMGMAQEPVIKEEEKEEEVETSQEEGGEEGSLEEEGANTEEAPTGDSESDDPADDAGKESDADLLEKEDDEFEASSSGAYTSKPDAEKNTAGEDPKPAEKSPEKGDEKTDEVKTENAELIDYKAAYEKIMAPFKAAGQVVKLESEKDVIQLMQMGAHYTKKMQALQPNLKLLKMLENNQLLDESKLSFLIDVSQKNPEAIQKLIRESGIDPIDIDTSVEPAYKPGNHRVSDEEIMFQSTLEEVTSIPAGKALISGIHQTWDNTSKEALWADPNIMRVLAKQKENGIYDQISSEIERRRTLGYLRNEPFLQAYEIVGKELQAQGMFNPTPAVPGSEPENTSSQPKPAARIVETRPASRKTVSNNDKAKAASPTTARPSAKPRAADFNPLAMSDEDFEKSVEMAQKL